MIIKNNVFKDVFFMKEIILDEEIDLNEFGATDSLNSNRYVKNLKKIIHGHDQKKTLTIGLFGLWGSGKSSIIRTAINEIKKEQGLSEKNQILKGYSF